MIAHIGALPLEEVLPVLTGAGTGRQREHLLQRQASHVSGRHGRAPPLDS